MQVKWPTDYMSGRGTVNIAIKQLGDALFWPTAW